MDAPIFYQLSIILALAMGVSFIFRLLRQPLVVGYMVTGFLAGPSVLDIIHHHEAFESFSQIGVTLLLFIVGLGLNAAVIRSTGKPVLFTFLVVLLGIGSLGYGAAALLGFAPREAIIAAIALLFSSTIIVVKSLSDKKEQSRLYGQIAIGILLVEDIVATMALLFVSASAGSSTTLVDAGMLLAKGVGLALGLTIMGVFIMPRLAKVFAKSQELLYVLALAWAFGVASVFWRAGFSLEVGALFAGVAFAHLPYAQEMSTRLKPLRDFFILLFFIGLGETLHIDNIASALVPALLLSVLVLVVKPVLIQAGLGLLGYTKQTGFKAAAHLSQISEFSVVLVVLAASTDMVGERLVVVMTLTTVFTIAISTYLMQHDDALYRFFQKPLSFFERGTVKREVVSLKEYPLILCGYREGGYEFIRTFRAMKKRYIVIDYDPGVIEHLEQRHIHNMYGDATDGELLDEIGVHKSEIVVSTIADPAANRIILQHVMRRNKEAIFICHATSFDEAEELYEAGAGYVILPHFISSEQINSFMRQHGGNKEAFARYRRKHLVTLGGAAIERIEDRRQ